jgi:hypothetical protein
LLASARNIVQLTCLRHCQPIVQSFIHVRLTVEHNEGILTVSQVFPHKLF